jgi:L-histidine Nalpha-methyltransferase
LVVNFAEREPILTEISRKFDLKEMSDYLNTKNLRSIQQYTDDKQWFGLLLCQKY